MCEMATDCIKHLYSSYLVDSFVGKNVARMPCACATNQGSVSLRRYQVITLKYHNSNFENFVQCIF